MINLRKNFRVSTATTFKWFWSKQKSSKFFLRKSLRKLPVRAKPEAEFLLAYKALVESYNQSKGRRNVHKISDGIDEIAFISVHPC